MHRTLSLASKLARGPASPKGRGSSATHGVSAALSSPSSASSPTASSSSLRRSRLSDDGLELARPSRGVCPCCFGAVHKPKRTGALDPALDPFFRPYSTRSSPSVRVPRVKMSSLSSSSKGQSVVQLILNDHNRARAMYAEYQSSTDDAHRTKLARELIKLLSEHGAQEEMSIYPWMKSHDSSTTHVVDHGIEEHRDLKQAMYELDGKTAKDPAFDACVQKVWKSLSHHLEEEETSILPKLEQMATAQELTELGRKFTQLEIIAPSRPHPSAPAEGVAAVLANTGAAIVDKARDVLREQKESLQSEHKAQ